MSEQDIVTPPLPTEVQILVDRLKVITDNDDTGMSPFYRDVMDLAKEAIDLLVKGEAFNPEPQPGSGQAGWVDMARTFSKNAEFYQGLVTQTGDLFGQEARRCDDGTLSNGVLALKVPELVKKLIAENKQLKSSLNLNSPATS